MRTANSLAYSWNIDHLPVTENPEHRESEHDDDDDDDVDHDDDDDNSKLNHFFGERRINRQLWYQGNGVRFGVLDFRGEPHIMFYNHFDFEIEYHEHAPGQYRVVGAAVTPESKNYTTQESAAKCSAPKSPISFPARRLRGNAQSINITYSYSVKWIKSDVRWASRWDKYLALRGSRIRWKPLITLIVVSTILCVVLSGIAFYFVQKEVTKIQQAKSNPNTIMSGLKSLKDVALRSPKNTLLLSVLVGNGSHLFVLALLTIVFAAIGVLSPEKRGSIATMAIYTYSFTSIIAGYTAAYCFRAYKGEDFVQDEDENEETIIKTDLTLWSTLFLLTPVLIPGLVFATFLVLNLVIVVRGSDGAVPFPAILKLTGLWFFVSIPLSLLGSLIGKKRPMNGYKKLVFKSNSPAPEIPKLPFLLKPITRTMLAGLLPFTAVAAELALIANSLWLNQVFFMFGFLMATYIILVLGSVVITIGTVYLMLLAGDYRWQWSSFILSGSPAIYVFLSCLSLLIFRYSYNGLTAILLYVSYSFLLSAAIFFITGSIGFLSTWAFVHYIYSFVRND
ncbi:Emp70p [Sugiyamaella lignohabitans]|uniref:Transmembrane 9 superfamily member n=1 Tax=Sugiyamaella lignohabitans TaxID=796027 RepID=A0A167EX15_9ASCO|nr:Emp70p [Sugiyamaella lignohabitans]ANB14558.1 Emp70p [Sugiyamaella lignohabitans]